MSNLIKFYVRVILNKFDCEILAPLYDLEIELKQFLGHLEKELLKDGSHDLAEYLQKSLNSTEIYCFKKLCTLNSKFGDLLSKIELIDGNDVDVFEIRVI